MEKEFSNEVKGKVSAYRFYSFEKKAIAEGLQPVVKRLYTKIERIENHPKNEGQVTFLTQIETLRREATMLQEIITEFSL